MKIAIVYDVLYPFYVGGAEIRNYELARRLSKNNDVHLYGIKLWKGEDIIKKDGIYYHGIGRYRDMYNFKGQRNILEPIKYSFKLYKELKKEKYDIIDCSAFPYFPCFACKLAKNKAKFIITWHQYWNDYWFSYLGILKGLCGYLVEKITKHLTKNIIAVSDKTARDLRLENIEIIYNGIDLKEVEKTKPNKEKSDLIYVGRLINGKNVDLLIKSIVLLKKRPKTIIIGDGPEKERLKKLTEKLGLKDCIKFLGFVEKEKVYSYLKSSKVFVFPSILEGFGMAVMEAMACRLPSIVIKHKWNAAAELVKDRETGLITENYENELARAITSLLKNEGLRKKMSKKAREKAQSYDWEKQADKLLGFYKSSLD